MDYGFLRQIPAPAVPRVDRRMAAILAVAGVLAAGLALLHAPGGTALERTGPLVPLGHALTLAAVAAFLWLAAGVGRAVLGWLAVEVEDDLEALLFGTALGAGVLATGMLGMGGLGLLGPGPIGAALALAAIGFRGSLADVPGLLCRGPLSRGLAERPAGEGALATRIGVLVSGGVALFLVLHALPPPSDWDSLMYHIRVPALFAEAGRVFLPADNLHFTRTGLAHLLYVPFLGTGLLAGPALLGVAFALVAGATVFAWCRRFHGARAAGAALATFWGSAALLLVAVTPRVDVIVVAYLLLAHYAVVRWLDAPAGRRRGWMALSALLLGMAVGVKFQALVYAAALLPLVALAVRPGAPGGGSRRGEGHGGAAGGAGARRALGAAAREAALYGGLVTAAAAPWLLKNWLAVGAPLYPIAAEPVLPGWLADVLGGRGLPAGVEAGLLEWLWSLRAPFNLRDFVLAPERLAIELEARHYFANPALLLLPALVWGARAGRAWRLALPGLLYLALLILLFPRANLRYLLPGLVPLAAAATAAAVYLLDRGLPAGTAKAVLVVLLAACLVPSGIVLLDRGSTGGAPAHAAGALSGGDYLASHPDPGVRGYARMADAVNGRLGTDARVLMLFEARGLYLEPPTVQDNKGVNWALLAAGGATGDCLEGAGFSHVLVNVGALAYYERAGLDGAALRLPELVEFRRRCLTPAGEWPGFVLFELRPGPAAGRAPPAGEGASGGPAAAGRAAAAPPL